MVVVASHHVGGAERVGEILEVLGDPARPHFRVRWDDERETTFYPGSDAVVRRGKKR